MVKGSNIDAFFTFLAFKLVGWWSNIHFLVGWWLDIHFSPFLHETSRLCVRIIRTWEEEMNTKKTKKKKWQSNNLSFIVENKSNGDGNWILGHYLDSRNLLSLNHLTMSFFKISCKEKSLKRFALGPIYDQSKCATSITTRIISGENNLEGLGWKLGITLGECKLDQFRPGQIWLGVQLGLVI